MHRYKSYLCRAMSKSILRNVATCKEIERMDWVGRLGWKLGRPCDQLLMVQCLSWVSATQKRNLKKERKKFACWDCLAEDAGQHTNIEECPYLSAGPFGHSK